MTRLEVLNLCLKGPWRTSGRDVQWRLDENGLFFQCTKGESDWKHNFDIAVQPYRDMPVKWYAHRGFVALWKSVEDEVMKELRGVPPKCIAGFSQGAALATLAHESVLYNTGLYPQTYAFASPRVVWMPGGVARRFIGMSNIQNHGDIVPHLPFGIMGYRHVGKIDMIGPLAIPTHLGHYPAEYRKNL